MPGIKELKEFTTEIHRIANEPEVIAKWGERYEEIPLPTEAPIPDINIDNLFDNIADIPEPDLNIEEPLQEQTSMDNTKEQPLGDFADFDLSGVADSADETLPDLEDPSGFLDELTDFPAAPKPASADIPEDKFETVTDLFFDDTAEDSPKLTKTAPDDADTTDSIDEKKIEEEADAQYDAMMAAASENSKAAPTEEFSLFKEEADIDEDINKPTESLSSDYADDDNTETFGEMLSNIDLDNIADSDGDEADEELLDVPEALLSGIDDEVEEARKQGEDDDLTFPGFDIEEPKELEDIPSDGSRTDLEDIDSGDILSSLDEIGNDDFMEPVEEAESSDFSDDLETGDDLSSGFDSSIEEPEEIQPIDMSPSGYEDTSDIESIKADGFMDLSPVEDIEEAESNSGFKGSEDFELSDLSNIDDTEQNQPPTSPEQFNFNDADIPELDEHTSFAIDDGILNTEMGSGMDEFSIPESFTQFSPDKKFKIPETKKDTDEAEYEGKIPLSINEADYDHFISRISSFPLNVRLEIQDYLINNDDSELNKMEIVHLIVTDVSLKKIAAKLEDILDKPIPIPKGFDKKSFEEYEQEKKSFKYKFIHKILPAAILTGIAGLLIFSLTVLGRQFIYKPIVAEGIYREGFDAIENGKYISAMNRFDEAGQYTKKRSWYFKYANAFRAKKQFLSAEAVYQRLLFDFKHDKQGGIEYAEMMSKDLRNYEKAETILRRRVLDYHINDEQALLSLGDTYLDWADEQPEKYAEAKKTYVSLINMYGDKDVFLSRMMRYFIRTDNLAEVLPLKDIFMGKKLASEDLVELSGYLLEKRYEPKPSDSDKLRAKIEDVRELLEKSLKNAPESPEAKYNMGSFFIYNRKPNAAKQYLEEAISIYENSNQMTPRRLIKQLDSMRLYGDLISNDKRYNEAQEIYAKALSKYKDYTAEKLIYPNKIIGKLYENYGDILYFISRNAANDYDYDAALDAYENAVKELNDTPSIRYKIGYIHYKKENYIEAMKAMTLAYNEKPNDKNLLYGFGNILFKRGNYFASQTYYEKLMSLLETERMRKGIIFPQTRPDHAEFVEDYMHTANNLGVVLNRLAKQNGDSRKNGRAIALFGESSRAWDALNRNPETMIRSKPVNLAYANIQNAVKPRSIFEPEIYADIPKTLENEKILQQLEDK